MKTSDAIALGAVVVSLVSLVVAGYAAWVSEKARKWQKTNDLALRTADIKFKFEHRSAQHPPGIHFPTASDPYLYWLVVSVKNDGETDEELQSLSIRAAQGADQEYAVSTIAERLSAHHTFIQWVDIRKVPESVDGYIARAQLGRGEPFDSGRVTLDDVTREKVRMDNIAASPT